MLELPAMNVQKLLPNTKPSTEIFSLLNTAGPGGIPFFDDSWLAVEAIYEQGSGTEAPQHATRLTSFQMFKLHKNPTCT